MFMTYALQGERMVHVDAVATGKACGCVCPHCGAALVAKNRGDTKEHHFAHGSKRGCAHGVATMTRRLLKEALSKHRKMRLPEHSACIDGRMTHWIIRESEVVDIERVRFEENSVGDIADIVVELKDKAPLRLCIKHEKRLDSRRLERIEAKGYDAVEVELPVLEPYRRVDTSAEVWEPPGPMRWLDSEIARKTGARLLSICEEKPVFEKEGALHVGDCPLRTTSAKRADADARRDCLRCAYTILGHGIPGSILCLGKAEVATYEDLCRVDHAVKHKGVVTRIAFVDGTTRVFPMRQEERETLASLWAKRKGQPFLARNVDTDVAVFIFRSPLEQFKKYKKCYGRMYKNGYDIGSREIYGAFEAQWVLIEKT